MTAVPSPVAACWASVREAWREQARVEDPDRFEAARDEESARWADLVADAEGERPVVWFVDELLDGGRPSSRAAAAWLIGRFRIDLRPEILAALPDASAALVHEVADAIVRLDRATQEERRGAALASEDDLAVLWGTLHTRGYAHPFAGAHWAEAASMPVLVERHWDDPTDDMHGRAALREALGLPALPGRRVRVRETETHIELLAHALMVRPTRQGPEWSILVLARRTEGGVLGEATRYAVYVQELPADGDPPASERVITMTDDPEAAARAFGATLTQRVNEGRIVQPETDRAGLLEAFGSFFPERGGGREWPRPRPGSTWRLLPAAPAPSVLGRSEAAARRRRRRPARSRGGSERG